MDKKGQIVSSAIHNIMKGGREMPAYNKPVRAAITEEQYKELMEYVKQNQTTVSQVLRTAVKEYLENHKEEN